jgi:hypothetical protein
MTMERLSSQHAQNWSYKMPMPNAKPPEVPNDRLHDKIGHLSPESQLRVLAALRKILPDHNREAMAHEQEKAKTATKH